MKSFKVFALATLTAISLSAFAGSEHDHGAPTFQPPKGGVLKSTDSAHFELVKGAQGVSIYAYDKEGKALAAKGFTLTAELELPRKKATPVTLVKKESHWEANINAQGAHRYSLKVMIDDGKEKDHVKFTVEN